MNLFGAKKKPESSAPIAAPQAPAQDSSIAAIAGLNEMIDNIGKKELHLQRKIDAEVADAIKFQKAGKKREAVMCVKKKKMYEAQLATLGTTKMNLEGQKMTLDSMKMNAQILDTQKMAAKSMQEGVKKMGGVDKVAETHDEIEEAMQDAKEIQDVMNNPMALPGIDADDDELFAEIEGMIEEQLAADLSKVELGRAVEMPSAPISLPAAGTKKVMTDEERELAELEAAMAG